MQKERERSNKDDYRIGRLSILELLTVLAILGGLLTWVLRQFFLF